MARSRFTTNLVLIALAIGSLIAIHALTGSTGILSVEAAVSLLRLAELVRRSR